MRQRKDGLLKLQFSDEPIYALGVLKKTLNMWSQRDISIYGRINIVKTLALSKLVFICSVMEAPEHFTQEVNKITSEFVWNHKPPKVKRTTILKSKDKGGLDMKDFVIFDKVLKLNWVKRLCSSDHLDAPWKYIPKFY